MNTKQLSITHYAMAYATQYFRQLQSNFNFFFFTILLHRMLAEYKIQREILRYSVIQHVANSHDKRLNIVQIYFLKVYIKISDQISNMVHTIITPVTHIHTQFWQHPHQITSGIIVPPMPDLN